jgi:uncharacterized lipoprotein NlpE involved in copper resistance
MKTLKPILAVAISLLMIAACSKTNNSDTQTPTQEVDMHNAQTSIDWEGTYFGVLPCGSCPGINTVITLDDDKTYEKTIEYLESNDIPETTKGRFEWVDKSIIKIEENTYLVGENKLFQLDINNKVIEGELAEDYTLNKIILENEPEVNNGYTLNEFLGSDNKEYDVIFNTNTKTPTAIIEIDDAKRILTQTQAWAKGAEYENGKVKLIVKGDKATLILDKKTIQLKFEK